MLRPYSVAERFIRLLRVTQTPATQESTVIPRFTAVAPRYQRAKRSDTPSKRTLPGPLRTEVSGSGRPNPGARVPRNECDGTSGYITRNGTLYMHVGRALPVGRAEPRLFVVPHVRRRRTVPLGAWTRRRAGGRRRRRGPFTCYGRCRMCGVPGSTKGSWLHIKLCRVSQRFVVTCMPHCPTARIAPVAFVVPKRACADAGRIDRRMPRGGSIDAYSELREDLSLRVSFENCEVKCTYFRGTHTNNTIH